MEKMKEFRFFTIFDHKKEEDYLREKHKSGWRFVRVSGFGTYHFEKCEPEDVVYQLDYNPQTKATKDSYLQIFADCGWEYIQDYAGYSYFRKPADKMVEEESIFNDDESRTAMMSRVYKGRITPLITIVFCCLVPTFVINLVNQNYVVASFLGGLLGVYAVLFAFCAVSHNNMKKK